VTLNLAETSVANSQRSVMYGANLFLNTFHLYIIFVEGGPTKVILTDVVTCNIWMPWWFLAHVNCIKQQVVLCKFYAIFLSYYALNMLEGATYDQHVCRRQITRKKSCVAHLQIVKLLTSLTKQQCYSKAVQAT